MVRRDRQNLRAPGGDEPRLLVQGEEDLPVLLLAEGVTRIGRASDCEVVLTDPSISAEHCRLLSRAGEVRVFDVGSTNGTLVEGEPAIGQVLVSGQTLEVGRYRLTYRGPRPGNSLARRLLQLMLVVLAALLVVGVLCVSVRLGWLDDVVGSAKIDAPEPELRVSEAELALADRLDELLASLAEKERELAGARQWHEDAIAEVEKLGEDALAAQRAESIEELAQLEEDRRILESERELLAGRIEQLQAERHPESATQQGVALMVPGDAQPAGSTLPAATPPTATPPTALQRAVPEHRPAPAAGGTGSRWLSERELDELASEVAQFLDGHAGPERPPSEFADPLGALVAHPGRHAAETVIGLYLHGRDLLTQLDELTASLTKRNASLHRKVREGAKSSSGSTRKQESDLRLYELSAKKIEILEKSRDRLHPLVVQLRDAIRALVTEDASIVLAATLRKERSDVPYCMAVCDALIAAHAEHATGELISLLVHRDEGLEARARRALIQITGEDLGTKASAWKRWAKDRGIR